MSDSAAAKWDARYLAGLDSDTPPQPAWVLEANSHLLPRCGEALDLACGRGGNALYLAGRGFSVTAWDISAVAIAALTRSSFEREGYVKAEVRDVGRIEWPRRRFDLIVVSRFLQRELTGSIIAALKPGGLLYYQTFVRARPGSAGPVSAEFLLEENELLRMFAPLIVRFYREDARCGDPDAGRRDEAYFVGQRAAE
ncbi:MAG: methyltransferase domain-containing protein [Methylotetracoccus sp.]